MADFTDRVKLVFEAVTSDATSGVGKLKSGVGEAEGAFGKLKAGAGGALDMIKNNAALSAGAAGVAIGAFIKSAIGEFQELALEANNFGDAVGLSVEDASRWIEVAGDLGVNVDALQGAVGKLNIATANGVLDKLGVGGDTTNERIISALEHLQGIPNAADRAKEGMAIFGKSWTTLSPLVETAGDLRTALADVSDQKVIDEAEVEKAKRLRDAMDELNGFVEDFTLAVGGGAAGIVADLTEGFDALATKARDVAEATGGIVDFGTWLSYANPVTHLSNLASGFKGVAQWITGTDDAANDAKQSAADLAESQKAAAAAAEEQAKQEKEAEAAIRAMSDASLAAINSTLGLEDAADRTADAIVDFNKKNDLAAQSNYGNAAANDEARRSMNDAEQAALAQAAAAVKVQEDNAKAAGGSLELADRQKILRDSLATTAGTLEPGSPLRVALEGYIAKLDAIPPTADTKVTANTKDAEEKVNGLVGLINSYVLKPFTLTVKAATSSAVPSSVAAPSSTAALTSGGPGLTAVPTALGAPRALTPSAGSVVNNISVSVSPLSNPAEVGRAISDALDAFYRRSGNRPRAVA